MFFFKRNKKIDSSFTEVDEVFSRHAKSVNILPRPGFKEALFARLQAARQAVSMSKFSFASLFLTQRRTFATAGLTVLVLAIITTVVFQPFFGVKIVYAQDNFTLTAEEADSLGIASDSSFILASKEKIDKDFVGNNLSVNTGISYSLEQVSQNKVRIAFAEPLPITNVVAFSLNSQVASANGENIDRPYNWAFQVKSPFRVVGTLPGNYQSSVPPNTGIEINFNYENIDLRDFEKAISISPTVKGHIEQYRKTFVFVPEENLQSKTVYTVTLSSQLGLQGSDEVLGDDCTFTFQTNEGEERGSYLWLGDQYIITTPNDTVAVSYSAWRNDGGDEAPIRVEVHQFISTETLSDYQQFSTAFKKTRDSEWMSFTTAESVADVVNMPVVSSFDASRVQSRSREYILFPAALPRGYYLAIFTYGNQKRFSLIESSQVTAYAAKAVNETLVWVNSAESKKPIVGASVNFVDYDEKYQTTDENGLAHLIVPSNLSSEEYAQNDLLEIRSDSEAILLPLDSQGYRYYDETASQVKTPLISSAEQNWSYFYTDRPMYQPNDTIKFWGYVENRENSERPESVRVIIGESAWCSFYCDALGDKKITFDEIVLEVSAQGTFTGELKLEDVPAGYYQVEAKVNEETIISRSVSVSEYIKPAFSLSLDTDKGAVFAGDDLGFTVHGEFFDGTPVNGLPVIVEIGSGTKELTLDAAGNARGNLIFPYYEDRGYPTSEWINLRPARSEEADIQTSSYVTILGPKVYLQEDWEDSGIKNGTGTLKVTAKNVQAVNSFEVESFAPTVKPNQLITGELFEITYKKVETGTTYDFIRKETISQYYYERVENKINDFSLTTDINGEATYIFVANNSEANYRVVLKASDENGRVEKLDTYVWQKESFEGDYGDNVLRFKNLDIPEGEEGWNFPGYKINDTVHLQVTKNNNPFQLGENGAFLYFPAHQGVRQPSVIKSNTYSLAFDESLVPNVSVYGVYFDGNGYAQINDWGWGGSSSGYEASYDNSEKELKVEVTANKETYRPGEEATLNILITNEDNKPVEAEVNLNIVDEAFYALIDEQVNPLAELYRSVGSGVLSTKVSLTSKEFDAFLAEGGGGGERGRSVFKDTADFAVVNTDESGRATYSLKLPDNITSWRITAQALNTDEKMAGDTKINLNASLPFFIAPIMRESYLTKDEPTILIRSAGTMVGLNDSVEYKISVPDANIEKKEFSIASETLGFTLPQLPEGKHEITITGSVNGLTDIITRSVEIVSSHLVKPVVSSIALNGQEKISGAEDGMTMVTFVDGGAGQYYSELQILAGNFGDRADEIMTRVVATKVLNEKFNEQNSEPEFSISSYQDGQGIKLLPYGDPDFDVSVRVAMAGGLPFDQEGLKTYFGNTLYYGRQTGQEVSREEAAKAYAAMAALGEPVLSEVQRLAKETDLEVNEKLYLALALHFSGDDEGARAIYRELVKGITKDFGYAYLSADDIETQGEQTSLLAILAAALRETDRDALHDYVTNQYQGNTLLVLDEVLFVKEAIKALKDSEVKVVYNLEGENREITLKNNETVTLALSPDELAALNPEVKKGTVVAVSRFDTPLVEDGAPVNEKLGLTRSYSEAGSQPTQTLKEGDLVKVEIKYQVPIVKNPQPAYDTSGPEQTTVPILKSDDISISEEVIDPINNVFESFEITDVLPSGLALVTPVGSSWLWQEKCINYPSVAKGQRVTFFVSNDEGWDNNDWCDPYTLTYYARVVTPGTYLAEPAYIRSVRNLNDNNHSAETTITITK